MRVEHSVEHDYATLLRDGVVLYPTSDEGAKVDAWTGSLVARAERDGLKADRVWYHHDDVEVWPSVELLRPNGSIIRRRKDPYPPIQKDVAAFMRSRAERAWGVTLERARTNVVSGEANTD